MKEESNCPGQLLVRWQKLSAGALPLYSSITTYGARLGIPCGRVRPGDTVIVISVIDVELRTPALYVLTPRGIGWSPASAELNGTWVIHE